MLVWVMCGRSSRENIWRRVIYAVRMECVKEMDSVIDEDAKKELGRSGRPQPSQIHTTLLLTGPAYN